MNQAHRFAIAATLLASAAAANALPSTLYVFGDSLVDAGNVFIATGGITPNPAQGYFKGRFQNGFAYTDLLQIALTGAPTAPSLAGGTNYAFGGARGTGIGGFPVPGLPAQLGLHLAATGGVADPNGLYVLNFGGNDVFGLQSGDIGGLTPPEFSALFVSNMVSAVTTLDALGASRILVMGVPNLTPTGFALESALQSALGLVEPTLGAELIRFSYQSLLLDFVADPTAFGFPADTDFSTPCFTVRPIVDGRIDCTGFLSFDGIHFTAEFHRVLAVEVARAASLPIPEPAAWVLLISGFGLVGAALRRSRRRISAMS
jgi:phospholipase/lecithinase/hemolysin